MYMHEFIIAGRSTPSLYNTQVKIIDINSTSPDKIIARTVEVLQAGGIVIFPTETTYGAGVDATNQQAVDRLLSYKSRREGKPMSIAVPNQAEAAKYVEVNPSAQKLFDRFLPGPVTVVCQSKNKVATGVASEFGTLGIRIPDYQLILDIVEAYGKPITATSANASGEKRPYTVQDIFDRLSQKQQNLIDLVLDAGELPHNPPSTVIDTTLSTPVVMRDRQTTDAELHNQPTFTLTSHSPSETEDIAGRLLLKNWNQIQETGLVIGLNGPLGIGKTIFAKGSAKFLKIEYIIKSPTYSYIEEYDYTRHQTSGKFYHLDLWKVDDQTTFDRLEIPPLIQPHNILLIEWWNQIAEFALPQIQPQLIIDFSETGQDRLLAIHEESESHVK